MMSKSLFFNLQWEDLKRRIWTIALSILGFFVALPLNCAMRIGDYNPNNDWNRMHNQFFRVVGPTSELLFLITIAGAVICGLSGFFYLHSRKKVDLYHSIPVRRETLFAINYLNGLIIYLIPYLIHMTISLIIIQVANFMSKELFVAALSAFVLHFLFYCMIYTTVIVAVMLTGNFIISCFGTFVFFAYGPVLITIKEMFFNSYFQNYYQNNNIDSMIVKFISPVGIYLNVINELRRGSERGYSYLYLPLFVATILLIGFSLFLYKVRPSEAAGKAMAFEISKPIIKLLLVVPISLGGGYLFQSSSYYKSTGWFIFGVLFSLLISYAVVEVIYNFDIRSAFRHKRHLLACAGITAVIAIIFHFDLLGYDNYIPKKNSIESMGVSINGLDDNIRYYNRYSSNMWYASRSDYELKNMTLTKFDDAYLLASLGVKSDIDNDRMANNVVTFDIKYKLKSGRQIYRTYRMIKDEGMDLITNLYENEEYRKIHFPIYQWNVDEIGNIYCNNMVENTKFGLDYDEKSRLLEIYKEELSRLTLNDMKVRYPIATLTFQVNDREMSYHVYPTFEKTIQFLHSYGFDTTKEIQLENIKEIVVHNYHAQKVNMIGNSMKIDTLEDYVKTYTDSNEIEEIFPALISRDYYWNQQTLLSANTLIEVSVKSGVDLYGNAFYYNFFFEEGKIPDFVKNDIGYEE